MDELFKRSFAAGVERISAWADLLDDINVYPIADGDTGRNLSISLSPLRLAGESREKIVGRLLLSARGNSGNIASRFFSAFYNVKALSGLKEAVQEGNARAWSAISNPRLGTMLSVFDALEEVLSQKDFEANRQNADRIISYLEQAVRESRDLLPKLKSAGVVDAGALGMYIFFEGFFYTLAGQDHEYRPITEVFKDRLTIAPTFKETSETGYCVDLVVRADQKSSGEMAKLAGSQENAIIIQEGDLYKIHLHTDNKDRIKSRMAELGSVMNWEDDNLAEQISEFMHSQTHSPLHLMTDAAGSITRDDARRFGFTLLPSYINVGDRSMPETHFHPEELYGAMKSGVKVSTSQASVFERHEFYAAALARFEKVLYLCVGSVFTGNYQTALDWKKKHDPDSRLIVMDTGAASGRLGVMALASARHLLQMQDMDKTCAFARKAVEACEEYVFLEKLEYLAAGGRLSKTGAFFGDMLKMKPVISPQPEGAKKMGVVRNRKDQVKMAHAKLAASLSADSRALIMLEHSDNISEVKEIAKDIKKLYPKAEVFLQPMSLTSGAHMGPGTWGIAFLKM